MDEVLIETVRDYELLYNTRSPDYRDQHMRQEAWEEIGRKLNIQWDKAKTQWDKLRRCFCNAINRRRDTSGMACRKKNPWKYEQQMAYILPFIETRKTWGNINDFQWSINSPTAEASDQDENQAEATEPNDIGEDVNDDYEIEDVIAPKLEEEHQQESSAIAGEEASAPEAAAYKERRRKSKAAKLGSVKKEQNSKTDSPAQQMVEITKETSSLRKRRYEERRLQSQPEAHSQLSLDDTDMFFLSMSRMTKKLSPMEQTNIKLTLSNAVLTAEARLHKSQQTSYSITSRPTYSQTASPYSRQTTVSDESSDESR